MDENRLAGAPTLANLIRALSDLADQSATLAADVRADADRRRAEEALRRAEEARRRRENRVALAILAALAAGLMVMLVIGVQNRAITKQNNQINKRVQDCTTEGGQCQQEGARRTAAAIDELERRFVGRSLELQVYLRRCEQTAGVDTDAELIRCVERKLAAAPSPSP